MFRLPKFFLGFFPALFITSLLGGCVHIKSYRYLEAPAGQIFLDPNPNFEDASFARWTDPVGEADRIRYLLKRMAASDDRFIRNGQSHDGKRARQWFLYKMSHWMSEVDTAEEFVTRVAAYSQKTGQPYLVRRSDGQTYSLASVLQNELSAFDAKRTQIKKPDISLSPTAVATTAVAASTSS